MNKNNKEDLIRQHLYLVDKLANDIHQKLTNRSIELEDLKSYGRIGLVEASVNYKPNLNVSFKTYAYYRIKGAIYDGLRKELKGHKLKFKTSAYEFLSDFTPKNITPTYQDTLQEIEDTISSLGYIYVLSLDNLPEDKIGSYNNEQKIEMQILKNSIKDLIIKDKSMEDKEKQILLYYYWQDLTFEEIAKKLNLTKSWICRLHKKALQKLKNLVKLQ